MESKWVIIYYCYGLNFKIVGASKVNKEVEKIKEQSAGEAGEDARQVNYIASLPAEDFYEALSKLIANSPGT